MQLKPDEAARLAGELLDLGTRHGSDPASGLTGVPPDGPSALRGGRLGHYRITRLVGSGGMGEVYEAEQENPRRRVALKVVRAHLLSSDLRRRFEHEVRILGSLQHPGIAQIFEAGQFDSVGGGAGAAAGSQGAELRPFFAMEYVEGEPLTKYAASRNLSVPERLELFLRVCQAVEHAHQRGVIHRDLKPANILVAAHTGAESKSGSSLMDRIGQPKVLDFGVARATDADITATSVHTEVGKLVGTLPYMSPEQASGDPNDLDTRSDVYALGVVLYELLSGKLPYEVKGDGGARVAQALRVIKEADPTPLSSVDRIFRGDLETIVGKALEKERDRRYQSVGELASDIRRYLGDEPIVARRASGWYQVRKFARRNRAIFMLCAGSGVLLLTLSAMSLWFWLSEAAARRHAQEAEGKAREQAVVARERGEAAMREAKVAEKVVAFMQRSLVASDSDTGAADLRVADVLQHASDEVDGLFGEEADTAAAIHATLAGSFLELGRIEAAAKHAEAGLRLARGAHGADHPHTVLALWICGLARMEADDLDRARSAFEEALGLMASDTEPTAQRSRVLASLAQLERREGANEKAEELIRRAIEEAQRAGPEARIDVIRFSARLVNILADRGKTREAYDLATSLIPVAEATVENGQAWIIEMKESKANCAVDMSRYEEAAALYAEVLAFRRRVMGPMSPMTMKALSGCAMSLSDAGKYDEAERLQREYVSVARELFGPEHRNTLIETSNLAGTLLQQGKPEEAVPMLEELVEIRIRKLGEGSPDTLIGMSKLSFGYGELKDQQKAVEWSERALVAAETSLEPTSPLLRSLRSTLGIRLVVAGELDRADEVLVRGLADHRQADGDSSASTLSAAGSLMRLRLLQGRPAEVIELGVEWLPRLERTFGARHWRVGAARVNMARALTDLGEFDRASEELRAAEECLQPGSAPVLQIRTLHEAFVRLYEASNRAAEAEVYRKKLEPSSSLDQDRR